MPILRMSTVFAQCANRLPAEEKIKLAKVFMLLTDNPQHPSLQLHKIEGARRCNIYECRLDRSWRVVLQRTGEMTFDLIYVGPNEEALHYGESLREPESGYGSQEPPLGAIDSYLAGCDDAVEFVAITEADYEKWGAGG